MADQEDQHSDTPSEDPKFIPLPMQAMAAKSLPGSNKAPESKSENDSKSSDSDESKSENDSKSSNSDEDMMHGFEEECKKTLLEELKRKAFFSALLAFKAETSKMSKKRTEIIEKLMKEWDIAQETRVSFEENIQQNLIAKQKRVGSDAKKVQMVKAKPLTISEKKPTLKPTSVATSRSSWGRVNPEDLLGRRVLVRRPCEEHFEDLVIKEYNAKSGMHRLVNADSDAMEIDEMLSWMDLREVPPADIRWCDGEKPNF